MKHILLFAFVFIVHIYQSSSQAIRLDSLWTKFGGVGAMSFSPDSKTLLIAELQKLAGGSGTIRFYDAATGIEKDSIPETEYYDVRYTPDGKRIVMDGYDSLMKVYNATTLKLEKTIYAPRLGGYIDFSPDPNMVVFAAPNSIAVVDIGEGVVKAVISRPYQYSTGPNKTDYYWNGKVSFSADGKYIIGKYQNSLARWDWRNAPDKPEIIIGDLGNRAIIGFSPDKKYMVQQSNYLWDLQQGKQISIEGLTGYESETAYGFASTIGSSCMVVTEPVNHTPQFINLATKKVLTTSPLKYVVLMSISPDSNYFAYQYGSGQVHLHKVVWNSTGISEGENGISPLTFKITPQPSNSLVTIKFKNSNRIPQCTVELFDNIGSSVLTIYQGEMPQGESEFHLNSSQYPSGRYYVRVKYGTQEVVHGFIITQ